MLISALLTGPRLPTLRASTARASSGAPASTSEQRLCLIDATNIAYRMHFAMPPLTHAGEPVHAVLGFCNKLLQWREQFPGYAMLALFEGGRSAERSALLPTYKALRKEMPRDLRLQIHAIAEASDAFGVPALSVAGYEADDLIATCTANARAARAASVTIITQDKDMLQLVSAEGAATEVTVYDDKKKLLLDAAEVERAHGVPPHQFVDYLSLIGDSIDNVPGIPGVGPKTAAKLLAEYGDLEAVLSSAAQMKKSKRRDALVAFADQARLAKRVVTLDDVVPLPADPAMLCGAAPPLPPAELPELRPFLQRYGLAQLERRLYNA